MNHVAKSLCLVLLGCVTLSQNLRAQDLHRSGPWDPAVVAQLSEISIQEGGRVKPLYTAASYLMLRLHQSRSMSIPDSPRFGEIAGERLSLMTWALDCLFYPHQANQYPVFTIQNDEALTAIGLGHEGKRKRDRYSYEELSAARPQLFNLSRSYNRIDAKQRSDVQNQVLDLARNVYEYEQFTSSFAFARRRFTVNGRLTELFPAKAEIGFAEALSKGTEIRGLMAGLEPGAHPEADGLHQLQHAFDELLGTGAFIAFYPPASEQAEEWLVPPQLIQQTLPMKGGVAAEICEQLRLVEAVVAAVGDHVAFAAASEAWHRESRRRAEARGEYAKVPLEVSYHRSDYFSKSLYIFGACFLLVLVSWLRPKNRLLPKLLGIGSSIGLGYLIWGITVRCILRDRPPVSTLYETVLFITAVVVAVALFMEWINRRRVGMSIAVLLGFVGLFIAGRYEMLDGEDTMPNLVAVLDTNFWLATHVTSVTMGYAAGLLAGFLAHFYLIGRMLRISGGAYADYRNLARMIYGVLCFGLLFSVLGTILGGVWANDSWGRFWGWDPKENGALMICLWNIMILHARMGGMVRDFGLAVLAVIGNCVVAFSWWGVNLLGVGLHSYGFTAGIYWALVSFYVFEASVVVAACGWLWVQKMRENAMTQAKAELAAQQR